LAFEIIVQFCPKSPCDISTIDTNSNHVFIDLRIFVHKLNQKLLKVQCARPFAKMYSCAVKKNITQTLNAEIDFQ
jgi:hypothetical protein